jgi:hypothetical protein
VELAGPAAAAVAAAAVDGDSYIFDNSAILVAKYTLLTLIMSFRETPELIKKCILTSPSHDVLLNIFSEENTLSYNVFEKRIDSGSFKLY